MATQKKRVMISILPEWESTLLELKKEYFYNTTQSEMLRFLVQRGLQSLEPENETSERVFCELEKKAPKKRGRKPKNKPEKKKISIK